MDSDKERLIQAINNTRRKIGLDQYPAGHLEEKDMKELESLYFSYIEMEGGKKSGCKKKKNSAFFCRPFGGRLFLSVSELCGANRYFINCAARRFAQDGIQRQPDRFFIQKRHVRNQLDECFFG